MKEITPKVLEHGATAITAAAGTATTVGKFFGFLDEHAAGLGVLLTFMSLLMALFYHELNRRKESRSDAEMQKLRVELRAIDERKSSE